MAVKSDTKKKKRRAAASQCERILHTRESPSALKKPRILFFRACAAAHSDDADCGDGNKCWDADFKASCHGKAMMSAPKINGHDQMQVLVALYDDGSDSGSGITDDQPIYVPHIQRCEFCPTNKENVLASFDHLHKCEVDKHLKHGLLQHNEGPIADTE